MRLQAFSDPESVIRRFWSRVDKGPHPKGCWLWTGGTRNLRGLVYGVASTYVKETRKTKRMQAHRLSYLIHHGELPDDLNICHHCDVPLCIRPDHLFAGTQKDNVRDMYAKNRGIPPRNLYGRERPNAKLDEEKVRVIRKLADAGKPTHQLAAEYGVCKSLIKKVARRRVWKHVVD